MVFTQKVRVNELPLDEAVADSSASTASYDTIEERLYEEEIVEKLDGTKKKVVEMLLDGYNFLEISRELKMKESQIYSMKRELACDMQYLVKSSSHTSIAEIIRLNILARLRYLPKRIFSGWFADNSLREYERPTERLIEECVEDVIMELGGGVLVRNNSNGESKENKSDTTI